MRGSILRPRVLTIAAFTGLLLAGVLATGALAQSTVKPAQPVFKVDVANPTKDKPQSKLWFAHGSWWAWLAVKDGSSVWKRSAEGWRRQSHLDAALRGLPGQADVWADADTATAVLVAPERLAVASLRWSNGSGRYELGFAPAILTVGVARNPEEAVETATIARDGRGVWWIAYDFEREMYVRHSIGDSAREWSAPIRVSEQKANEDDICMIVALPGSVGVVWSDQDHDAVYFREHLDSAPAGTWKAAETADSGGKTADDHLNAAVASDGTLYLTTKDSVDMMDRPQLVLRIRNPEGKWANLPYAPRTKAGEPSRPIVLLTPGEDRLLLSHTLYHVDGVTPRHDMIVWQSAARGSLDLAGPAKVLIDSGKVVNDVTGPKAVLPAGELWVVLASDRDGGVFEAVLR